MKHGIAFFLLATFLFASAWAQQDRQGEERTTIIIQQEQAPPENFYSIRVGAWFPKDWEQSVSINNVSLSKAEGEIDQSQALGIDFHFRKRMGHPLYADLSASAWYSSYVLKLRDAIDITDEQILSADAWVVIIPVTVGLSFAPLPENPFQPYAMVGGGAYFGITGRSTQISNRNELNEDDTHIRFGWYLGAGVDFLFSPEFGISAGVKYQFLEFEKEVLTGQKDFTGLQATLGIVLGL